MTSALPGEPHDATISFSWRAAPDSLSLVPVRVRAGDGIDTIAAMNEWITVPAGTVRLEITAPGYAEQVLPFTVRPGSTHIPLSPTMLTPLPVEPKPESEPRDITVGAISWGPSPAPVCAAQNGMVLRIGEHGVTVTGAADVALTARIELASWTTPRRLFAVPPLAAGNQYHLAWHRPPGLARRPRLEPADSAGQLLMSYLLAGRYRHAAAAARAAEQQRGQADPLTRVTPSYTQLLIGYAYALGEDWPRLARWCMFTTAAAELGSDGLVLAAESAWHSNRTHLARDLLARAGDPPTVTLGGERGIRLATLMTVGQDPPDPRLLAIVNRWLPMLTRADANAANLSVAPDTATPPDTEALRRYRRWRWQARHLLTGLRQAHLRTAPVLLTLTKEKSMTAMARRWRMTGTALLPTALLIGATVLLSTVTIWLDGTRGSNTWLTLGALWALLFLAIGALTASYHYQRMLMEARTSLIVAERRARDHYDTAIRGRALAAAIYADENHRSEEADRYARIARQIFSDPTPPRARTHDQP